MKQIYSKMLLLVVMLVAGSSAWAQDEDIIYETGFEAPDFTATTTYNTVVTQGPEKKQWETLGSVTINDKKSGAQGLQMRVYKTQTATPYAQTNFDLSNITKIEFYYRAENITVTKGLKVLYSLDSGANWKIADSFDTANTQWTQRSVTIPEKSDKMRIRFEVVYVVPDATKKLTIDDIKIYSSNTTTVNVTGISLNKTWIELTEGDTYTLTAAVTPENATNDKVLWTSADDDIVSVNNGIITALKSGSTYITATTDDGGFEAYCQVSVKKFAMPNHVKFVFAPNGTNTDNSNSWSTSSKLDDVFSEGYEYISKINTLDKVYPARNSLGNGVKFGTTKAAGTISFDLKGAVKARYVVVTAALYSDTEGQQGFTINGVDVTMPNKPNKVYCEYGIKLDGSDLTTITLSQKEQKEGRIYVESIDVYATSYPSFFKQAIKLSAKSDGIYYGTFSDEHVTFFPRETVTVSTASVNEKSKLILNPIEDGLMEINGTNINGSLINSNNGVIITSPESIVNYFTTNAFVLDDCEDNMLRPSSAEMKGDFKFYKLAYGDIEKKTGLGFYYGAEDGAAFESKAGLAYLAVPTASAGAKAYTFAGESTSISMPTLQTATETIYNLNGQRLSSLQKGINLVDGKKIFVK